MHQVDGDVEDLKVWILDAAVEAYRPYAAVAQIEDVGHSADRSVGRLAQPAVVERVVPGSLRFFLINHHLVKWALLVSVPRRIGWNLGVLCSYVLNR